MRLPPWLTKRMPPPHVVEEMENAFMILGNYCTRNCSFCAVKKGVPSPPDPEEPENVAKAVNKLGLNYVVITSPTRDDLPDGGAAQFARVISSVRKLYGEKIYIEILIPDFGGSFSSLQKVLKAKPFVLNHNLETVPRLYPEVRPGAEYQRSLRVLERCKKIDPRIYTKSGLMVGLGESQAEVIQVMKDLRSIGCDILTIGQYLRPSSKHLEVKEFIPPEVFDHYREVAYSLGFLYVASSPFVRSSYMARDWLIQ